MGKYRKYLAFPLSAVMLAGSVSCCAMAEETEHAEDTERQYIEETLNLANNESQEWTYSESADAWVLSAVSAVAYPELPDQQGVSVCVPGAYVIGIDSNGDGTADITSENALETAKGSLVIDYEAEITSSNGTCHFKYRCGRLWFAEQFSSFRFSCCRRIYQCLLRKSGKAGYGCG